MGIDRRPLLSAYHFHDAFFDAIHRQGDDLWITLSQVSRAEAPQRKAARVRIVLMDARIVAGRSLAVPERPLFPDTAWAWLCDHQGGSQLFSLTCSAPDALTMIVSGLEVFEVTITCRACCIEEEEPPCSD